MNLRFAIQPYNDGFYCMIAGHPMALAWGETPWVAMTRAATFAMIDCGKVAV